MIKWKLKIDLTEEEALEILQELYDGCKKKLIYSTNEKINPDLIKIYQSFKVTNQSNHVLNFSDSLCSKPFISCKELDHFTDVIKTPEYNIYIYE